MQRQKEAIEAHAAQEERHEQGKRRAKLEAGFAEVALSRQHLHLCDALQDCTDSSVPVLDSFSGYIGCAVCILCLPWAAQIVRGPNLAMQRLPLDAQTVQHRIVNVCMASRHVRHSCHLEFIAGTVRSQMTWVVRKCSIPNSTGVFGTIASNKYGIPGTRRLALNWCKLAQNI